MGDERERGGEGRKGEEVEGAVLGTVASMMCTRCL